MRTRTFHAYQDPDHYWIKIPFKVIIKLEIIQKIRNVRIREDYLYLPKENIPILNYAAKVKNIPFKIVEHEPSPGGLIKNYEKFRPIQDQNSKVEENIIKERIIKSFHELSKVGYFTFLELEEKFTDSEQDQINIYFENCACIILFRDNSGFIGDAHWGYFRNSSMKLFFSGDILELNDILRKYNLWITYDECFGSYAGYINLHTSIESYLKSIKTMEYSYKKLDKGRLHFRKVLDFLADQGTIEYVRNYESNIYINNIYWSYSKEFKNSFPSEIRKYSEIYWDAIRPNEMTEAEYLQQYIMKKKIDKIVSKTKQEE